MLTLSHVFYAIGALLAGTAVLDARDRRWAQAAFWAILAAACFFGDRILAARAAGDAWPAQIMGGGVIAIAVLAAIIRTRPAPDDPEQVAARERSAERFGGRLFVPVLLIPGIVAALVLADRWSIWPVPRLLAPGNSLPLVALGLAAVIALIAALGVTRSQPVHGLTEGRRLLDTIGWPAVLPIMLATLGAVFVDTGVGQAIAALVAMVIPIDSATACLLAFGLGMVAFTVITGNAFTAFPVMMAGVGLPLLIKLHGAQPGVLGALGMLTGYCGTLVTPMAANFNVVPVLLLELRDPHAVIRAQWPTALGVLVANLILMALLVFR